MGGEADGTIGSTTSTRTTRVWKGRRGVLETFRDRTRLLREAKSCSIMGDYETNSVCLSSTPLVFAIYPSRVSFFPRFALPEISRWKKILLVENFAGKSRKSRDVFVSFRRSLPSLYFYPDTQLGSRSAGERWFITEFFAGLRKFKPACNFVPH